MTNKYSEPLIFNIFKPARMTSFDVVRFFKRNLPPGYGKIGHFGTLDPFACGVLMIGVNGAAKLNDFIHEFLPKTYIAVGKLGVETVTGDLTETASQIDTSSYLKQNIASFDQKFIEEFIQKNFVGEYWQAPHKYSAAKHEGKALHKWAREGVEIQKEKKKRYVYKIDVIKYSFPYLSIKCVVSSGTYIRTLFSDIANKLGTLGCLVSLIRQKVGSCHMDSAIKKKNWPHGFNWPLEKYAMKVDEVLPFGVIYLAEKETRLYKNGVQLHQDRAQQLVCASLSNEYYWVKDIDRKILGLAKLVDHKIKTQFNLI